MIQSRSFACAEISCSVRYMRERRGSPCMTHTGVFPRVGVALAHAWSPSGISPPDWAQIRWNDCARRAAAGPTTSTPVSRQGGSSPSPCHSMPMQKPPTKAVCPSTHTSLRWSRWSAPSGFDRRGGLKARTSTPASRRGRKKRRGVAQHPSQS